MNNSSNPRRLSPDSAKPRKKIPIWKPLVLLLSTALAVFAYQLAAYFVVTWTFKVYYFLLFAVSLAYVFYNRGFSRWFVKPEMLPRDWPQDKKDKFFDDSRRWKRRSEWMLYILFPLLITFVVDFFLILWEEFSYKY